MDFKKFAKNNTNRQKSGESGAKSEEEELKKTFDDTVKRAKGKSQNELMDEILRQAAKDKRDGKLSDKDLQNFFNSVAPMLNPEQIKKLKEIMNLLK